ncbi:MAG: 2-oxoacid ferredoxin oxidoreductase [Proteobacteria bacterium]|nr:2-oxoacid ferredoxin oxidoreductase [Pseudomonadota bacterium]
MEGIDNAWCPGCGDFGILNVVKGVFEELDYSPNELVMVSGIGQAAKLPQYLKCNYFNGLHGRALPVAVAIKASNPELKVIAESGDGDMYGEGGNHFMHTIRRNPEITNLVHNNMVYGLTKGQASPTSQEGFVTPVQRGGVISEPFNPIAVAIALNASFVARAFIGDPKECGEIIKAALLHKGYALVDILQPCPSFNKVNTYRWFKENTYYLDDKHDSSDRLRAFEKATLQVESNGLGLGIFYTKEGDTFEERLGVSGAAYKKSVEYEKISKVMKSFSV